MDFSEFKRRLQSSPTFRDLERWIITDTDSGLTSPNSYRFQCGERDYFVKEVKENEKRILGFLTHFELDIAPRVVLPELLEQDIAVYEYVCGTPLEGKTLPQTLIENYALWLAAPRFSRAANHRRSAQTHRLGLVLRARPIPVRSRAIPG
jgi:hypothetical protein